jgi:predicted ATPase
MENEEEAMPQMTEGLRTHHTRVHALLRATHQKAVKVMANKDRKKWTLVINQGHTHDKRLCRWVTHTHHVQAEGENMHAVTHQFVKISNDAGLDVNQN